MQNSFARTISATAAALLLAGCTTGAEPTAPEEPGDGTATATVTAVDPASSMTEDGARRYAAAVEPDARPRYDVEASVEPATGEIEGTVRATLPRPASGVVRMRYFAGLPALEAQAGVGEVTVDGDPVEAALDGSILTLPLEETGDGEVVSVVVPFGYTLPEREPAGPLDGLLGDGLDPGEIGLLARHPDVMSLGHWMPLWIPEGRSAEPVPDGYGDIGNFAAGDFRVALDVPQGWTVVDGGVQVEDDVEDGRLRIVSEGAGMRDFVVSVLRDHETRTRELDGPLDGVRISATAPRDQVEQIDGVLDETEVALRTLSEAYGTYPWREFDVVAAPLSGSVGGMEWPGATWIESGLFAGGVPGLGDLGGLEGLEGLDDLGGLGGLLGGETGLVLRTVRAWTIAHEVAHSWWTVLVGNDSVEDPVVDEPLAQYASCLVLRASMDDGDAACRAHITTGYEQMRMLGESDTRADQPTDEFASSTQYGGVVYGKAAAFYLELEERFGAEALTTALRELVDRHAFETVTATEVEAVLTEELGDEAGRLWTRWMERRQGDADLTAGASDGTSGGTGGPDLSEMLAELLATLGESS